MVIASEEAVKEHNLTPLARVVSWGMYVCLSAPVFGLELVPLLVLVEP